MPFLEPAKVLLYLIRGVNLRTLREPVTIRALSATHGTTVRSYGTGKYMNSESATNATDLPYFPPGPSRFGNPRPGGLTDAGKGKNAEGSQARARQDTSEKAKMEEEEVKAYQAEVEKHNKEFERGHDRGHEIGSEPKVDEKFWKGYKERPWKHKA